MNTEKIQGKYDQVAGKIKQGVGEAIGNQKLANAGAAEQIKGVAKETWGNAKDTAAVVHDDNQTKAHVRAEETAHNLREHITTTAQNIKHSVNEKLDDIKREHRG
jgi:uncharacterized protein YjbJ (UPF0337 family)